jgi:hypothetical protein
MAKIILLTGTIVGYAYCMELFMAYYSANPYEQPPSRSAVSTGPSTWAYYFMFASTCSRRSSSGGARSAQHVGRDARLHVRERRHVVRALRHHRHHLERHMTPGSWRVYQATWVDKYTFLGTFGFFMMLFLLFLRFLPVIAIGEVKGVLPQSNPHQDDHARAWHSGGRPHGLRNDRHVP